MSKFEARTVAESVQKKFATKILSNRTVVNNLIDEKTGNLLNRLFSLIFVFVSISVFLQYCI